VSDLLKKLLNNRSKIRSSKNSTYGKRKKEKREVAEARDL
jgi:hypothetical protein